MDSLRPGTRSAWALYLHQLRSAVSELFSGRRLREEQRGGEDTREEGGTRGKKETSSDGERVESTSTQPGSSGDGNTARNPARELANRAVGRVSEAILPGAGEVRRFRAETAYRLSARAGRLQRLQ